MFLGNSTRNIICALKIKQTTTLTTIATKTTNKKKPTERLKCKRQHHGLSRNCPKGWTNQETVEELVDKEAEHANQDICHVVEKGHVQDDRSITSGERASVSHKTHQEHDFITQLKGRESGILVLQDHLEKKTL